MVPKREPGINYFVVADDILKTMHFLDERRESPLDFTRVMGFLIPFGVESSLKALIVFSKSGQPRRTHDLLPLFDMLRSDVREELDSLFQKELESLFLAHGGTQFRVDPRRTIRLTLKRHRKHFQDWRYPKGDALSSDSDLQIALEVCYGLAAEYHLRFVQTRLATYGE